VDAERPQEAAHVVPHGLGAEVELVGDLLSRTTLLEQSQDVSLTRRELRVCGETLSSSSRAIEQVCAAAGSAVKPLRGRVRCGRRRRWARRSTFHATLAHVPRSLHVRLDDSAAAALEIVRADGLTDSEAVRTALREAAARRRVRSALREEVRQIAADERDRDEMRRIREQLAELAPPAGD
jgi:hypothetical protein